MNINKEKINNLFKEANDKRYARTDFSKKSISVIAMELIFRIKKAIIEDDIKKEREAIINGEGGLIKDQPTTQIIDMQTMQILQIFVDSILERKLSGVDTVIALEQSSKELHRIMGNIISIKNKQF